MSFNNIEERIDNLLSELLDNNNYPLLNRKLMRDISKESSDISLRDLVNTYNPLINNKELNIYNIDANITNTLTKIDCKRVYMIFELF